MGLTSCDQQKQLHAVLSFFFSQNVGVGSEGAETGLFVSCRSSKGDIDTAIKGLCIFW